MIEISIVLTYLPLSIKAATTSFGGFRSFVKMAASGCHVPGIPKRGKFYI